LTTRNSGSRRRLVWRLGTIGAATVVVLVGLAFWRNHYLLAEQRVLEFCRHSLEGRPVAEVAKEAIRSGLTPRPSPRTSAAPRILVVEFRSRFLPPLSVCTLRHDGSTVTMASWDPWYH